MALLVALHQDQVFQIELEIAKLKGKLKSFIDFNL